MRMAHTRTTQRHLTATTVRDNPTGHLDLIGLGPRVWPEGRLIRSGLHDGLTDRRPGCGST
jgi:hypothetical protein